MPVTSISSKELMKRQQDHSNKPGALSQARRDQEEFTDYTEGEITPVLTELLAPGLGNSMYGGKRTTSAGWHKPRSGPRSVCA